MDRAVIGKVSGVGRGMGVLDGGPCAPSGGGVLGSFGGFFCPTDFNCVF